MEKFTKFNTFGAKFFIIILFQGFPSKSCIGIFALRVTINYAYRPFVVHFLRKKSLIFLNTAVETLQQMGNGFEEGE